MTDTLAKPLTYKQERFVEAMIGEANGNLAEAARIAGFKDTRGYPYVLMQNPAIRARVEKRVDEFAVSSDRILQELADIAYADWKHFIVIKTNPKTGAHIDVKMDLTSKVKALELLGKHKQLFTDKLDIDVNHVVRQIVGIDPEHYDELDSGIIDVEGQASE